MLFGVGVIKPGLGGRGASCRRCPLWLRNACTDDMSPHPRQLQHRCPSEVVPSWEATTSVPLWCRYSSLGATLML